MKGIWKKNMKGILKKLYERDLEKNDIKGKRKNKDKKGKEKVTRMKRKKVDIVLRRKAGDLKLKQKERKWESHKK